jgi:hypothetical protein
MLHHQPLGHPRLRARHVTAVVCSLLALAAGPPARAVTTVSIDGHPAPTTIMLGETVTIHFDVGKAGGACNYRINRDLTGSGKYDATAPNFATGSFSDGSGQDSDPAPGKVATQYVFPQTQAAGPYVLRLEDITDGTAVELPGITVTPKPEAQSLSGHVAIVSADNPAGAVPPDAMVWAYDSSGKAVANTNIRRDGSYTLPVPAATYTVFAEWLGNLHSLRQTVTVASNEQRSGVDIALLHGQEVAGTVRAGDQRVSDALVEAVLASGAMQSTRTQADGSYVLVLPAGQHRITTGGTSETVTVADGPVDGVDFPTASAGPAPGVGTIVTVAGNGIAGHGGDGRTATTARLNLPISLVVDRAGNLYVSYNLPPRVRKVEAATGIITTIAGSGPFDVIRGLTPPIATGGYGGDGGPATQALLNNPQNLALDKAGNLFISEVFNHRIRKVDAVTGIITTAVGTGKEGFAGDGGPATQAQIAGPQAMAFDAAGNLYFSDNRNRRIRKVDLAGTISTVAGGGTAAVTDGAQATAVALVGPRKIATDGAGNLFIGDGSLNRIFKMSPVGTLTAVAGTGTAGFSGDGGPALQAQFNAPFPTLAVDSAGNLFLADTPNHRLRKISPDGTITTVAGSGPIFPDPGSYAGDGGPALAARLWGPGGGLAIDATGNLIFTDNGNNRVRKIIGIAAPGLFAGQ